MVNLDRRSAIGVGLASFAAPALSIHRTESLAASPKRPVRLRVCGVESPLALAERTPHFSWLPPGRQTAYRITLAATERDLLFERGLLWDSGWTQSDRYFDVAYTGKPFTSRTSVFWRVECKVDGKAGPLSSSPQKFETGLSFQSDWRARWLASECDEARRDRLAGLHWISSENDTPANEGRLFRWTFDAEQAGAAEFLISIDELNGVWLNGAPIKAQGHGAPHWTTMAVYPAELRPGRNIFAVKAIRRTDFHSPPMALAALLRHGTSLEKRTTSVAGWKTSRVESPLWTDPDFDISDWVDAIPAKAAPVGQPWPTYPAMYLRRPFQIAMPVQSARLYSTACGVYEASINGQRVGEARMTPELTDARKRLLYQAYDVTELLTSGENVIGFEVADGWYASEYSLQGRYAFGNAPCRILAQLEITFLDGSRFTVASDRDWRIAPSPVITSEIYDGEVQDARLQQRGWNKAGFDDSGWAEVSCSEPPIAAIEPQISAPITVTEKRQAVRIVELESGDHVVDFGQNFTGWVQLTVSGSVGDTITVRYAELLNADGSVDQSNLRSADARNVFILTGERSEALSPRFTFHGFRYVQITGLPSRRKHWTIEALVAHQNLEFTGDFRVGNPVIQKFWENSVWSQRSNFFGLPTDCPQRDERLGWMGDAQVFWDAAAYNMDVQAFTSRFLEDVRHGQNQDGGFADCIPPFFVQWSSSSPGWADGGVILPYVCWRHYGDTEIIRRHWTAMERYLGSIHRNNPDFIWRNNRGADFGDWLAVDAVQPGDPTTPKDLIGTAFWAHSASLMTEMAQALGDADAVVRYSTMFESVKTAFQANFVRSDGRIGNGSQTSCVLAIRFGLLPDGLIAKAGRLLKADIDRRGGKLSTGFLGTPHILDALALTDQEQTAIDLLLQRDAPSWGYMVMKGATTMWERWNSDQGDTSMNSRNHYAFGAIGSFLFRRIAGIDPVEPGFRRIRVNPIFDARLKRGGGTYRSISGTIRTDWIVRDQSVDLTVDLPANVRGTVVLNGEHRGEFGPGLHQFRTSIRDVR